MINNPVIKNLVKLYEPIASLNYFNYLAGWDTETYLPIMGINARSRASADLAIEIQSKYTDREFLKTLESAHASGVVSGGCNTPFAAGRKEKSCLKDAAHIVVTFI